MYFNVKDATQAVKIVAMLAVIGMVALIACAVSLLVWLGSNLAWTG